MSGCSDGRQARCLFELETSTSPPYPPNQSGASPRGGCSGVSPLEVMSVRLYMLKPAFELPGPSVWGIVR